MSDTRLPATVDRFDFGAPWAGQPVWTQRNAAFSWVFALIVLLALSCYQMALIAAATRGMGITNGTVAACEAAILLAMAGRLLPQRPVADFALPAIVSAYLLFLFIARDEIDPVAPRDLLIIVLSYWLGQSVFRMRDVNRIVCVVFLVVFVFACMEYFFTDAYLRVFDILGYATARGVITQQLASYSKSKLFFSGMREAGRNILPFLGNQRVSSVFYEPVSMGNFGVILAMWGLSFDKQRWRQTALFLAMAAIVVIACDSRFASLIVIGLIVIRLIPILQSRWLLILGPVFVLAGLVAERRYHIFNPVSDDLPGRIARTGDFLVTLRPTQILGLDPPEFLGDSGIPYSIELFGAALCIALWIWFVCLRMDTAQGRRLRAMATVYCLGLLVISGTSFYSSKTAAMLWFLLGAVSRGGAISSSREETAAA